MRSDELDGGAAAGAGAQAVADVQRKIGLTRDPASAAETGMTCTIFPLSKSWDSALGLETGVCAKSIPPKRNGRTAKQNL